MDNLVSVLGLVLIIEGIPYFAFPEKMKAMLSQVPLIPARTLRIFGIAAILSGLGLVYLARKVLS